MGNFMMFHGVVCSRPRCVAALGLLCLLVWSAMFGVPARADSGADYARQVGAQLIGRQVPPLRLSTLDGQTIDLGALRGHKAVYLKFWATWCVPCREQMPHFENVQRHAGNDLQVIAVNIGFDDTPAQIAAYRREHGLTMPIVRDDDGHLGELFGLRVTPQHVVIGQDGRIAYVGHLADAALERALTQARQARTDAATHAPTLASAATTAIVRQGDPVPALAARTLEGTSLPLIDPEHRRPTVLAFFSPWCEGYFAKTRPQASRQCRIVRETLADLAGSQEVRWIGVASGLWASEADLRGYRDEHGVRHPLALDSDGRLFRRFAIRRMPAVRVLDARGRLQLSLDDEAIDGDRLRAALNAVIAAARSSAATAGNAATAAAEPLPMDDAFVLSAKVGADRSLVFDWTMPPGYYLYRDRFSLKTAAADTPAPLQWAAGERHRDPQFGEVTVFHRHAQLRVPLPAGTTLPTQLPVTLTYQGCLEDVVCYPPTTKRLNVAVPPSLRPAVSSVSRWAWLVALLTAFAGGLVLNLMPCVLPVLSLKVLALLQMREDPRSARRRALAYTAGVLVSFAALGVGVLALRASGAAAGWGVQMQQPWIVAALALVMLAVGLSLSGVVQFGVSLAGLGGRVVDSQGLRGEFLVGVLACVVASPCTAPFMGAALAYAFGAGHAFVALAVFLALGLGLAAPFLLMAFVPATARWLPQPGAWMETLKQLLAFPMYATAVWLLWVLGQQRGADAMAVALLAAVGLALALWWYEKHRFGHVAHRVAAALMLTVSLMPVLSLARAPASRATAAAHALPAGAERFTAARLAQLRQAGTPVFVNVTADWCLTCHANDAAVLDRSEFRTALKRSGTTYLVADYTRPDPAIAALLQQEGAVGLPLYIVYRDGQRIRLPSVLTPGLVADALSPTH